jgi:hypothetical protein
LFRREYRSWADFIKLAGCVWFVLSGFAASAQPQIVGISPAAGPEGTRVEIRGRDMAGVSEVRFGATSAVFRVESPAKLMVIVPHKASTSTFTLTTPLGRSSSSFAFVVLNDPRIPDEVSYKAGYVNPAGPPADFRSARLWGIAIADTRVPGYESATVEIASTKLTCKVDDNEVVLNDDGGQVRGGLYLRQPWFATDAHEPIPLVHDLRNRSVVLAVGKRTDRIWHFWSPSPRTALPLGKVAGCTVRARVRISAGALLQVGMDYWRSATIP